MKRLNIFHAFQTLGVPSTKEDIIIQMAKHQNIRFNELPGLQIEVDHALTESIRLGFVDRHGTLYKLNIELPGTEKLKSLKQTDHDLSPRPGNVLMNGQGDEKLAGCTCTTVDPKSGQRRRRSSPQSDNVSVCTLCGLNSENQAGPEQENDDDNCKWPLCEE